MIYTSYFDNIQNLPKDSVLFSIAGRTPDWFKNRVGISQKTFTLRELAPKRSWWKEWEQLFREDLDSSSSKNWYRVNYTKTVLNAVDAQDLVRRLEGLSDGKDIILLCYEDKTHFCHRQLVSEWLNDNMIKCKEY